MKHADAVIIGGGVRGCSIALFLARAGVQVALVERRFLGCMASSANGGQVNVTAKQPDHYTLLSLRSARMYSEFVASLEENIFLKQTGIVFATMHVQEMEMLRERVKVRSRLPGLSLELLDAHDIRELVPVYNKAVLGGYISSADGVVDPLRLVPAIGRAARREGVAIFCNTEVTGIDVEGDRVRSVVTSKGRIATPVVVNAAGVHVPHIGSMVGISIPVNAEHGHLVVSCPMPRLLPLPTWHVAQWPHGGVTIGTTNNNIGFTSQVVHRMVPPFVEDQIRLMPALGKIGCLRVFAALRPMPPDRLPIYDRAPGIEGFYIAVGHSGITLAPVTGKIFADWIVHGKIDAGLAPYALNRFASVTEYS